MVKAFVEQQKMLATDLSSRSRRWTVASTPWHVLRGATYDLEKYIQDGPPIVIHSGKLTYIAMENGPFEDVFPI